MDFWTSVLEFATTTTASVGQHLLGDFGTVQASEKQDGSLVTRSDQWADEALRTAIATTFPDHGVLSEEVAHIFPATDWCWIIDPLDGTTNFARGLPIWGISLGLLYRGTPVFGYVHFPPLAESFHGYWAGETGLTLPSGAFRNRQPIHVSSDPITANHFFNLCTRSTGVLQNPFPCKIRMLGVATYNVLTVATGACLGGVEATPKIWDIAAVWVILQAAGGIWTSLGLQPIFPLQVGEDYGDRPFPTLVVSQEQLLPIFHPLVQSVSRPDGLQ
jgi:myo-inositol-1(or 4)-monophosphatase